MNRKEAGAASEERAARFLKGLSYKILEKNFRSKIGEIDIIAQDGDTVVFVEVRSRQSAVFGLASETVQSAKRRHIIKTALFYAQIRALDCPMRFDVVAIQGEDLEHIPAAFEADGF